MGIKESKIIQLSVIDILGDNPAGMCTPLAIIESMPNGIPHDGQFDRIAEQIIKHLKES